MKIVEKCKCYVFGFIHGQASGGVLTFVKKSFLNSNFTNAQWTDLVPGRIGCLSCWGPHGQASFYNCHFFPADRNTLKTYI